MTPEYDIAILLATRGRTDSLGRCIHTLIESADNSDRLQLMFAFDNDDTAGTEYFQQHLQPWMDERDLNYTACSSIVKAITDCMCTTTNWLNTPMLVG